MRDKPLNPYVRLAMHDRIVNKWEINRAIWDYEIIYIEQGKVQVTIGNKNYLAKTGDIIFLTPNIVHTLTNKDKILEQPHCHFDLFFQENSRDINISFLLPEQMSEQEKTYFRHDNLAEYNLDIPPVLHLYNAETIKGVLYEIIDEMHLSNNLREEYISSLMNQLLVLVARGYQVFKTGGNYKSPSKFLMLEKYIINNMERNPSIEELAKYINTSKSHFIEVFKKHYQLSPHAYINNLRIGRAKEMVLHYLHLSLTDISEYLHFDSLQSFSNWFKKYVGFSPKEYRNNH